MIIADENIPKTLISELRNEGFEVYSIFDESRGIEDLAIATLSLHPPRIVLTQDNDFGRMVFEESAKVTSVVFLRFEKYDRKVLTESVVAFFKTYHFQELLGKFVTITPNKIRTKLLPNHQG